MGLIFCLADDCACTQVTRSISSVCFKILARSIDGRRCLAGWAAGIYR
jgi:hypothetical protein